MLQVGFIIFKRLALLCLKSSLFKSRNETFSFTFYKSRKSGALNKENRKKTQVALDSSRQRYTAGTLVLRRQRQRQKDNQAPHS